MPHKRTPKFASKLAAATDWRERIIATIQGPLDPLEAWHATQKLPIPDDKTKLLLVPELGRLLNKHADHIANDRRPEKAEIVKAIKAASEGMMNVHSALLLLQSARDTSLPTEIVRHNLFAECCDAFAQAFTGERDNPVTPSSPGQIWDIARYLAAMAELAERDAGSPTRPPQLPVERLIVDLAEFYERHTGKRATAGRADAPSPFARFLGQCWGMVFESANSCPKASALTRILKESRN